MGVTRVGSFSLKCLQFPASATIDVDIPSEVAYEVWARSLHPCPPSWPPKFRGLSLRSATRTREWSFWLEKKKIGPPNQTRTLDHSTSPLDHSATPLDHCTTPLDHSTTPLDHSTFPLDHSTTPLDHPTTPLPNYTTPLHHLTTQLPHCTTQLPH